MTYLKAIFWLALVAALVMVGVNIRDTYKERDQLKLDNATLAKANKDLVAADALKDKQRKASDDTVTANAAAQKQNNDAAAKIASNQTTTREIIIKKYAALPQTPDTTFKRNMELSMTDFNAMWQTFCTLGNKGEPCSSYKQP